MDTNIGRAPSPGFLRRLAAMVYDLVLLFGVLMIAVTLLVLPYDLLTGVPFPHEDLLHSLGLRLYLVAVICLFFVYFWTRGGQTLGMRTWHFGLVRDDGSTLRRRDALVRLGWSILCLAPFGAILLWLVADRGNSAWTSLFLAPASVGFWWMLLDRDRLTCYDRLSRTRPVMRKT